MLLDGHEHPLQLNVQVLPEGAHGFMFPCFDASSQLDAPMPHRGMRATRMQDGTVTLCNSVGHKEYLHCSGAGDCHWPTDSITTRRVLPQATRCVRSLNTQGMWTACG